MSAIANFVKSGAWLILGTVSSKLASALSLPMLARLLGPESLGIYSIIVSLAQSAQSFSSVGADISIHRNGAQHQTIGLETVGRLFGVGFVLICIVSTITGVGVWVFREPLALHWLGQTNVTPWLEATAILIVLQPLGNVPLLFLAGLHDFRAYALQSTGGILVSSVATVLLGWKMGLAGAVLGLIIAAVFQIVWSFVLVSRVLQSKKIQLRFDRFWQESYSILQFGFPYYFGNTLLGSLVGLPLIGLVSQYGGLEQLGYLRVAQSMAALIGFIPAAIAPATISYLSAPSAENQQAPYLKSVHLRSIWIMLVFPTGAVCLILPDLITLLFGMSYQQATILSWLSLWIAAMAGIASALTQYLVASSQTRRVAVASTLGVFFWVFGAYILVPHHKALGFLIAQAIGQFVGILVCFVPATQNLTVADQQILKKLILLTILYFIVTSTIPLARLNHLLNLGVVIGTFLLFSTLLFKIVLYPDEKSKIKHLLALSHH